MADPINLSPFPQTSPLVKEDKKLGLDWLNWFKDLSIYIPRILNSYHVRKSGTATLVAGSVVVTNTLVTATSKIRLNAQNASGTAGFLSPTLNPGVGLTITSTSLSDTRTILYEILEAF